MDQKLEHRLERAGFETIEPQPGEEQPPPRKLFALSPINQRRLANFKRNRRGLLVAVDLPGPVRPVARSPSSSPTTGRSSSPTRARSCSRCWSTIRNRSSAASWRPPTIATRSSQDEITGERLDDLAADPLLLPHRQQRDPDAGAGGAVVDDDAGGALPALSARASTIPTARSATGTGWAPTTRRRDVVARLIYGFRISVEFGLTLAIISSFIGVIAGRGAGLFRRLGRPRLPALHRDLDVDPGALSAADHLVGDRAELLGAARHIAAVLVGGAGRRGAGGVPARPQLRIRQRGAGARRRQPARSCSATSCPTPWWRR